MATPQTIVNGSSCFGSCIPDPIAALIWQFDQIRINGGGEIMTPQQIATASACFGQCIADKLAALIYLANVIEENGAGDANFTYTRSAVDPVAAPPTANAEHWNETTDQIWNWNGSAWV